MRELTQDMCGKIPVEAFTKQLLTDTERKLLMEYLYDKDLIFDDTFYGKTGQGDMRPMPSFTTYEDSLQLAKKMVEKGDWKDFTHFIYNSPWRQHYSDGKSELYQWLFIDDPRRLPWLVKEWRREWMLKQPTK